MKSPPLIPTPTEPTHRARRCDSACDREALAALVAASFAVSPSEILSASRRSASVAFARQVAMYLAHVSFGASYSEIGRAFSRDRTTAAHACRVVEERRDDPRLDATLDRLERTCRSANATVIVPRARLR